MVTRFKDSILVDDIHYNESSAVFIATYYHDILVNVLK